MSRIGNSPVAIPKGVTVSSHGQTISAKGPVGNLTFEVPSLISFEVGKEHIKFSRPSDERNLRALHGMARSRTASMVRGCAEGWERKLEINGVGYRAVVKGKKIDLVLGFSHPISYPLPDGVKAKVEKDGSLVITSADKALVGQVAADIRAYRPPEPYKGKGVKYVEERIIRKEGKAGKK